MHSIEKLVRERRSVRTYDERKLSAEPLEQLRSFMAEIDNPWKIPVQFLLLDAKEHRLTCPVVVGTVHYVGGKHCPSFWKAPENGPLFFRGSVSLPG